MKLFSSWSSEVGSPKIGCIRWDNLFMHCEDGAIVVGLRKSWMANSQAGEEVRGMDSTEMR